MTDTRTFEAEQFMEMLDEKTTIEIGSRPWRHGQKTTYVVAADDAHYMVEVDVHYDEGIQVYGPFTGIRVVPRQEMVTKWVVDRSPTHSQADPENAKGPAT